MNKVFNSVGACLLLSLSFALASCSTEDTNVALSSNVGNSTVIADLETLNSGLLAHAPQPTTRGWSKWSPKQRMVVVAADWAGCKGGARTGATWGARIGAASGQPITGGVFGAVLGGIIGGGFASWLASPDYCVKNEDETTNFSKITKTCRTLIDEGLLTAEGTNETLAQIPDKTLSVDKDLIIKSGLDDNSLQVGKMHNIILASLDGTVDLEAKANINTRAESVQSDRNVDAETCQLQESIVDSKELMDSCKIIAKMASKGQLMTSDPISDKIMDLFKNILENYSVESSDVAFVIGKYTEIINKTNELTEEQKREIKAALATALYSSKYWETKLK